MDHWVIGHDGIERRGRRVRRLPTNRIRRVHTFTEQDGQQALVFRAAGWRTLALTDERLRREPRLRHEAAELIDALSRAGAHIDADVKDLLTRLAS